MQELFTEIFPINLKTIPQLSAYAIAFQPGFDGTKVGGKLAYRLNRTFPGNWLWADYRILTDTPVTPVEMDITVDILRENVPDLYGALVSIEEDPRWRITPDAQASYVLWAKVREVEDEIREALSRMSPTLPHAIVERHHRLQKWIVEGQPAFSLSVQSRLVYHQSLQQVIATFAKPEEAIGLLVTDRTSTMAGEITQIAGVLRDYRERLLNLTRREEMQSMIRSAPDDEPVVVVASRSGDYEYPASALSIILRLSGSDDLQRFGIPPEAALKAIRLRPDARAQLVKTASDILKAHGIIESSYNTKTHPHLFDIGDFEAELVFDKRQLRPYKADTIAFDFLKCGVYKRHPRFEKNPITIAVINTLDESIDDFVEAMRRQLERGFGYQIALLRERKVRVVSQRNIESAVRVVEKETPHIVLAFFPDEEASSDDDDDSDLDQSYRHLKSLTVAHGIASHIIYHSAMHDPEAMPRICMAVLSKTGNMPYGLSTPLPYADRVVGLDMVRQSKKDGDHIFAMARIYDSEGQLLRYILHHIEVDSGDPIPFVVMQTLFPQTMFAGKRILVHRAGEFSAEEQRALKRWGQVLKADFYPVEIHQGATPRLYGLEDRRIVQPKWGSSFKLDDHNALLVTSRENPEVTPKPLHIRSLEAALPIENAVHSVLSWILLHHGAAQLPKLPVTVQYSDEMARWLAKGVLPTETDGDTPFWL